MRKFYGTAVTALTSGLMLMSVCVAQTMREPIPKQGESLKSFLQSYLGKPYAPFELEGATRYSSAFVDLKGDGTKEVVIYVSGRAWCGSGGCIMLILAPEGTSYRVITRTTITRPPIRILNTKSNGWHDIGVVVAGGDIACYEAILPFDGKTYPSNPSVPPARRSIEKVQGETVISATAPEQPLYPIRDFELKRGAHGLAVGISRTKNPAAWAACAKRRSAQIKFLREGCLWHQTSEAAS